MFMIKYSLSKNNVSAFVETNFFINNVNSIR